MITKNSSQQSLEGKRILVIEDDNFISKVYTKWLTLRGAEILVATNGALGLRTLEEQTVDLILLDLGMPGMDGYQTVAELRSNPLTKNIPIIILSNTSLSENENGFMQLKNAGVESILQKYETSLAQIVEHITKNLENKAGRSSDTMN